MASFHVNDEGNVGRCTAKAGNCRFGGEDDHASTREEAREKAERKLEEIYSPLGKSKNKRKRPIDYLTNLLFAEPIPRPRERKPPMPKEFHMPRGQNGWNPSHAESESDAETTSQSSADHFEDFVKTVETANFESQPDRMMSQAAWNVHRDRIFDREIPVVDEDFKLYYNNSSIENSNLTLQGWSPENETQDYIVKDLVSNVLAQHETRLEIDGITTTPFNKSFDTANNVETVGKPNNANQQLQTVSDFSSGVVSGLIDATERAKNRSFPDEATEEGRKKQLKKFLEEEAFLYESSYNEDKSDFNDGRSWIVEEWLQEL